MPSTKVGAETLARQEAIKVKALAREAERAAVRAAAIAKGQTPPDLASLASTITNSPSIAVSLNSHPRHSHSHSRHSRQSSVNSPMSRRAQIQTSLKKVAKRVLLGLLCSSEKKTESEEVKREKVLANLRDGGVITAEEYLIRAKKSNRARDANNKFNSLTSQRSIENQHQRTYAPHLSSSASTSRMVRKRNGKSRIPRSRSVGQSLKRSTTQPPSIPPQEFSKIDLSPRPNMPEDDRFPVHPAVPEGLEDYDVTYHPTRRRGAWTYGHGSYDAGERIGEGSGVKRSEEGGEGGDMKRARLEEGYEVKGTGVDEVKGNGSDEVKGTGGEVKGTRVGEVNGSGEGRGNGKQSGFGNINMTIRSASSSPTKSIDSAYLKGEAWIGPQCPGPNVTTEFAPDHFMPASTAIIDYAYPVGHPLRYGLIPDAVHTVGFNSASATIRRGTHRPSETGVDSLYGGSGFSGSTNSLSASSNYIKGEHGKWEGFKQKIGGMSKGRKTKK